MKVVEAQKAAQSPNPHQVDARLLHENDHIQVVAINLQPGEALKRHVTPVDVCFYVLEGRGVAEIGEERQEVSADMLIDSPARIPHRLLNESDAMFRFLVLKTPKPTESTRIL